MEEENRERIFYLHWVSLFFIYLLRRIIPFFKNLLNFWLLMLMAAFVFVGDRVIGGPDDFHLVGVSGVMQHVGEEGTAR